MSVRLFRPFVAIVLVGGCYAAFAGCGGCSPGTESPASNGSTTPDGAPVGAPRKYGFRCSGNADDLPWNQAIYVFESRDGKLVNPTTVTWFDADEAVPIAGRPGARWVAHAEPVPTPAILRILWDVSASGTYGADAEITIALPPRARLRLTGDERTDPGADTLTVADEQTGARMACVRDATSGYRFGIWDAAATPPGDDWRVSQQVAPPRPWVLADLRPGGTFAIAARTEGKCWTAMRATMRADDEVVLDVADQPEGGATIVCENPRAELLLDGDIPVPPIRVMSDFYRARWPGVPAGSHAVRYPDGKVVPVVVDAGAAAPRKGTEPTQITLPRDPPK